MSRVLTVQVSVSVRRPPVALRLWFVFLNESARAHIIMCRRRARVVVAQRREMSKSLFSLIKEIHSRWEIRMGREKKRKEKSQRWNKNRLSIFPLVEKRALSWSEDEALESLTKVSPFLFHCVNWWPPCKNSASYQNYHLEQEFCSWENIILFSCSTQV
jgi:septum formation topological specificity factor MinE